MMFDAGPKKTPDPFSVALLFASIFTGFGHSQDSPPPAPKSARELLATYGIGPAEFSQFVDGHAITPDEQTVLAKILFRFSRMGPESIHRWRKNGADWDQVAAAMHQNQGELFAVRGRAKLVTEHKLPPEMAEQMEFGRYYTVEIALDDAPRQALDLYPRGAPRVEDWPTDRRAGHCR